MKLKVKTLNVLKLQKQHTKPELVIRKIRVVEKDGEFFSAERLPDGSPRGIISDRGFTLSVKNSNIGVLNEYYDGYLFMTFDINMEEFVKLLCSAYDQKNGQILENASKKIRRNEKLKKQALSLLKTKEGED